MEGENVAVYSDQNLKGKVLQIKWGLSFEEISGGIFIIETPDNKRVFQSTSNLFLQFEPIV